MRQEPTPLGPPITFYSEVIVQTNAARQFSSFSQPTDAKCDEWSASKNLMTSNTCRLALFVFTALVITTTPLAADVTAPAVDAAIQNGREALLQQIRMVDEITYQQPGGQQKTVRGTVTRRRGGIVIIETSDGSQERITERYITNWARGGFVNKEEAYIHYGGRTALACLALLNSDLELSEPRLKRCVDALALHPLPESGTYVRALRASIWSHLLLQRRLSASSQRTYKRLLETDMTWLEREMQPSGAYDYGFDLGDSDSSNTQFAHLGLWRGNLAGAEINRSRWERIEDFWLKSQSPSGGWSYVPGASRPTSSMTVAGCNSLYIVLDRLYARADRVYRPLQGCQPNKVARKQIEKIFAAIRAGNEFLDLNPYDPEANKGYELFGIERLGLVSGEASIGNRDWYRDSVGSVSARKWSEDVIADSFALIFLVHGQAPVLFQKLAHGSTNDDWNYYFRDLHGITSYINGTFERLHRWQYVPANATLPVLKHAPFLLISGTETFGLDPDVRDRLTQYIADGGTLVFHADLSSRKFAAAARKEIEKILAATPWPLRELSESHPLFSCQFNLNKPGLRIPVSAAADGPRLLAVLFEKDIAGGWHQRQLQYERLFQIIANLRTYAAPTYSELPRVLPQPHHETPRKAYLGNLTVRRFAYHGDWRGHFRLWERQAGHIEKLSGVRVMHIPTQREDDIDDIKKADMLFVAVRGQPEMTDKQIEQLRAYADAGGFILIESTDGQKNGNAAVLQLMNRIDVGKQSVVDAAHPLITGAFPGGSGLDKLNTSAAGASLLTGSNVPPLLARTVGDDLRVLACPFDLSAALDRHHIWQRVGLDVPSTDRLVSNILAFRRHQLSGDGRS